MRVESARYALVSWPDDSLGCVLIETVEADVKERGAVVIAREFEAVPVEASIEPAQSNPRRAVDEGDD